MFIPCTCNKWHDPVTHRSPPKWVIGRFIRLREAVALTQAEWDENDLFITDYARNGEVLFAA
jgi:hypothetical protein